MGPVYAALGMTVGVVVPNMKPEVKRAAYACDITYASVNEIGFDVLRDQLVTDVADLVSPNPDVALVWTRGGGAAIIKATVDGGASWFGSNPSFFGAEGCAYGEFLLYPFQ